MFCLKRRSLSPGARSRGSSIAAARLDAVVRDSFSKIFADAAAWGGEFYTLMKGSRPPADGPLLGFWCDTLSCWRLLEVSRKNFAESNEVGVEMNVDLFLLHDFVTIDSGVSASSGSARDVSRVVLRVVNGAPATGLVGETNAFTLTLSELMIWAVDVSSGPDHVPIGGRSYADARSVHFALVETCLLCEVEGRIDGPLCFP